LAAILTLSLCAEAPAQRVRQTPITVVINEVLASNGHTLSDPQNQYDDWIELYNPGGLTVDIGGCYLTDDLARPTKWQVPTGDPGTTMIPAHGYLLLWADGDLADAGLHAGFRLDADGEDVALFAPDGLTLIDSLSFGRQYTDMSYGRYPDGAAELRLLTYPTPGFLNVILYEGIAEPPRIDTKSRVCIGPITVSLTAADEEATIYYTLDGSDPFSLARDRPTGSVYTAPVVINKTATLKAIAWRPGWRQSEVSAERYVFLGRDLYAFSSPLAIAVIDTFGKSVSRTPVPAYGCFIDLGEDSRASMTGPTDFAGMAALNVRGKSSEGFPKHQYHLETQDEQGDDQDVAILGLPPESDWVLQGPYSDKSLLRNVLSYRWANEMGRYAPRTRLIEMFLNSDDSTVTLADYVGVYVLMEKIKIGPSRVDIATLEPSDNAEPEVTGGYIIKKDKFDGDDQTFSTNRGQSLIYQDPNGPDLTQAQKTWIRNYFNSFEAALYGPAFNDPVHGYAKYIDVDSFIDLHILVELTKNIDGFRLSTYMHKDRAGKLSMGPAWDYNLSLGNADYLSGWLATGWYFSQLGDGDYPYWRRLFEDPEFKLRYADRWFALRRDLFATARLLGMIEGYAMLLDEPAARNFDRWRILGQYVWPNWFIARTFREEIAWMEKWLADRLAWMDRQIATEFAPAPPVFGRQGGQVEPGFSLVIDAPGTVYYTTDGSDPRSLAGPTPPGTGMVLVAENAPKRVLVPARSGNDTWRGARTYDDSAWMLAAGDPGGVGFEKGAGYERFISLDLGPYMYDRQASCYIRIPFVFSGNAENVDKLTLKVRYDDGFIAYLNGVEIARRNFTGAPAWNSAATSLHDDSAAVVPESIEVTGFRTFLRPGDNVLACHAMNASATSSDFLLSVELVADETPETQAPAQVTWYTGPVILNESTRVRARSLNAGRWSALNDATFSVGPVAESLRISEIMYHPAGTDDPNAEYVELTNIGTEAIQLNLVRFTDGIEFTFPRYELPPAAYCLVVGNLAAFEARYGPDLPIAGQYAGVLSNAGERIVLEDAAGRAIHNFSYSDDWYSATDGAGFSLILVDPLVVDPSALGDATVWRPSGNPGGSPGAPNCPNPSDRPSW